MKTITLEAIANEIKITPMAICGNPQIGKTTLAKHLVKALNQIPNVKVRVWDSSTKWLFNAPVSKVFSIPQPQLTIYTDLNPIQPLEAIEYESGLQDSELEQILNEKCIAFDTSRLDDLTYERQIQARLINIDKTRQVEDVRKNKGVVKTFIVWLTEESQGVWSSNSLRRKNNEWLAKCISISANFGISYLIVSRRANEVSTLVFEHTNIKAIGNSTQPNSIRKLKTILSWDSIERMKTFGKGEFIVLTNQGEFYLKTKPFKGNNPEIIEPQTIEVKQGFKGMVDKAKGFLAKLLKR